MVVLTGCGSEADEWERLAMPDPVTTQGESTLALWQGAWIAALLVGVLVWGLIFFVSWHFRRRSDDEIPIQTRYNLPLEIFYTIAPILMVVVLFAHTVRTQNVVLDKVAEPDNIVEVTAQQWSWTFNHGIGEPDYAALEEPADADFPYDRYGYEVGDGGTIPTLYLPVDQTTRFNLHSPDVIHNFGVPGFLMKLDVMPGRVNSFEVKPTKLGEYAGKCFELCGVYHARMLFNVEVVSQDDYAAYVEGLAGDELTSSDLPLTGGENSRTPFGSESEDDPEGEGK